MARLIEKSIFVCKYCKEHMEDGEDLATHLWESGACNKKAFEAICKRQML